jgi:hypothetical protein
MLTATSQSYLCLHGSSTKTKTASRIRPNSIPSDGLAPTATKPSAWKKHLSRSAKAPEAALECRMSSFLSFHYVSSHGLVQPPIVSSAQLILLCRLAYCELYVTLGTLFRRFDQLEGNHLTADDLIYDDYFSSYHPLTATVFQVSGGVKEKPLANPVA